MVRDSLATRTLMQLVLVLALLLASWRLCGPYRALMALVSQLLFMAVLLVTGVRLYKRMLSLARKELATASHTCTGIVLGSKPSLLSHLSSWSNLRDSIDRAYVVSELVRNCCSPASEEVSA